MQRRDLIALALAATAAAGSAPALAQGWPSGRTLTMVVGFPAGGAADNAARIIAKKLTDNLGQNVVVDNKAGAGGNIAHQQVAQAAPDGATILLGSVGPLTVAPHMMKVGYDPQKDLAPLTMGVMFPNVLVAHPGLGVKSIPELLALAKKQPGKLNYASTGNGSASHLAGELLAQQAGIDIVHIPYKGGAPAMTDLLAGRVSFYFATYSTAQPHIATGKLVALATSGLSRPPFAADIPTIAEAANLPGFNATNWYAFVAPGKTPAAILDRWNAELTKALRSPDTAEELSKHGLLPAPGTRAELARTIEAESRTWGKVVAERKISAD